MNAFNSTFLWDYSLKKRFLLDLSHGESAFLVWLYRLFCHSKVELFLLKIGFCDLNSDGISKLILMMMTPSDETEVSFVKVIIVISQVAHRDHTFTMVLIYLSIYTITRDTANVGIVCFA